MSLEESGTVASLQPGASNGRAAYLQRRRETTRATIVAAAKTVFARANYVQATIDDIIRAAEVSRATFYSHFESKLELACAIYDEIVPENAALFARLPGLATRDRAEVRRWLEDFVAMYVEHRYVVPLIAQLQLFESGFRARILSDTDDLMDRLAAAGLTAFATAGKRGGPVPRERVRGRMLLNRIAAVCGTIAAGERPDETECCLDILSEELLAFLHA